MRKLLIIVTGSLAVVSAGWCFGQTRHGNDGNNGNSWRTLPSSTHAFYVAGFTEGYALALVHEEVLIAAKNAPEKVPSMTLAQKKYYEETLRWAKRIVPFKFAGGTPKPVEQLEGALDTFYSDYRNMPVCWDEAMLFSLASLAGNAATDQELDAARKKGAESGCK
jgi:hypothetical protein